MLHKMSIQILHDFIKLLLDFDFSIRLFSLAGLGFDKYNGFDGIFLCGLDPLSIKQLKLLLGFFPDEILSRLMMTGGVRSGIAWLHN